MNEDEAFIRAVVDGPTDDTPRLVYADWLDDRSDPRGPYLRAEFEWARSGKKEKPLRAFAAPLDPVWVARVSRPPVGICVDRMVMSPGRAPLAPADLDAVEARLKVTLPAQYRALLLNWNGAAPSVNRPPQPKSRYPYGISELAAFLHVVPVGGTRGRDTEDWWDVVDAAETYLDPQYLYRHGRRANAMTDYIPLAQAGEGDFYMIGVRGKATGKVAFFHDFTHNAGDPEHLGVVAPSLGALFALMLDNAPEWYRLAQNGDEVGLLAWIDAGGSVNVRHPENREQPLSMAMGMNDLPLVRELLARGAKVDAAIRELAGYLYGKTGKKIRDAVLATKPKKPAPRKGKK